MNEGELKKVEKIDTQMGFKTESRCKVCSAIDLEGNSLREMADALVLQGRSYAQVADYLKREGVDVGKDNIYRHITNHSAYIKKAKDAGTKTAKVLKIHAERQTSDADAILQKIIDAGEEMIQNWMDGKEDSHQLPITERLFIESIKEQGKRKTVTAIDMVFLQMDQEMIDAEQFEPDAEVGPGDVPKQLD